MKKIFQIGRNKSGKIDRPFITGISSLSVSSLPKKLHSSKIGAFGSCNPTSFFFLLKGRVDIELKKKRKLKREMYIDDRKRNFFFIKANHLYVFFFLQVQLGIHSQLNDSIIGIYILYISTLPICG